MRPVYCALVPSAAVAWLLLGWLGPVRAAAQDCANGAPIIHVNPKDLVDSLAVFTRTLRSIRIRAEHVAPHSGAAKRLTSAWDSVYSRWTDVERVATSGTDVVCGFGVNWNGQWVTMRPENMLSPAYIGPNLDSTRAAEVSLSDSVYDLLERKDPSLATRRVDAEKIARLEQSLRQALTSHRAEENANLTREQRLAAAYTSDLYIIEKAELALYKATGVFTDNTYHLQPYLHRLPPLTLNIIGDAPWFGIQIGEDAQSVDVGFHPFGPGPQVSCKLHIEPPSAQRYQASCEKLNPGE